jgi:HSP20 family protein
VKRQDVDVRIGDDLVTISGSAAEREGDVSGYVHRELRHGSFSRSFRLPTPVRAEAATASLRDGLLTLTLPRTDHVMPTQVKVEVEAT